ncbi:electron transfer flavoprotein subunit beta/FixA family protein [Sporomusa acidovorans]|uniref:Electron transfer flavoprotein small subunit n=1 Tax=Sporomusa acidovorans (strain ATCC 49682 / DSM 3132 / Mol) TaxID=1123286 RepID=A0ABZ3IYD9_SPOA4|nr:electron transfer flavoprotein subunit beta/FixA family protein [Sporomusa acidovorans]OZC22371.1 acryloyl-CoA reductase electron transfer subunit gamma [Sporomusa acidovorans DSM 3132]SDE47165.1 electron transfer flavoprotein beta subunit [Sporomusa acidovorans]
MNIIVCIKQVPGTSEVEVDQETGVLKREGIDSKMNPYDLFAIETAVKIKEENGAKVSVVSMGPPQAAEIIREAYMMGVDEGALISDRVFAGADVLATSYTISQGIKKLGDYDLLICGKQTTDGDTAQVGPELAEFLGIPHIANVKQIVEVKEHSIIVDMDMPHAVQTVEVSYPCLITVEKDINQPRLPSFKRKLSTKDKQIPMYGLKDFADQDEKNYGINGSPTRVLRIFSPEANHDREMWKDKPGVLVDRLAGKLKELKYV